MLRFHAISKGFSGVQALQDVSFEVADGSVHGLCGENGAGNSTLLKVLSGVHQPDSGTFDIDGKPCNFRSALDALNEDFADIIVGGKIEVIKPTPDELEDKDRLDLARIAFNFNRRDYGRVRQLIDVLNGF